MFVKLSVVQKAIEMDITIMDVDEYKGGYA